MVDMIINGVCIAWIILGIIAIAAVIIDLFGGNKDGKK